MSSEPRSRRRHRPPSFESTTPPPRPAAMSSLPLAGSIGRRRIGAPMPTHVGRFFVNRVMVRYKVKPDQAARNEELVRRVYDELHQTTPSGLRYATFVLEDGVTFVHI